MTIMYILIGIVLLIALLILSYYLRHLVPLRPKENGFEYVFVENDGTVRELDKEDQEYLLEEFSPTDGARPYIKSRYSDLTPDKKQNGFISRRRVPKSVKIKTLHNT